MVSYVSYMCYACVWKVFLESVLLLLGMLNKYSVQYVYLVTQS